MIALRLEVFETEDDTTVVTDRAALEEARRAAHDEGFAAGRAAALAEATAMRLAAERDAARNLQDLAFTFHEARAHVLAALGPLIEQIAMPLLPAIARETLARDMADAPVRLAHHPDAGEVLARLANGPMPLALHADPTLPEGAVQLRLGDVETRIDLTRATQDITAAIRGFFQMTEQDRRYG